MALAASCVGAADEGLRQAVRKPPRGCRTRKCEEQWARGAAACRGSDQGAEPKSARTARRRRFYWDGAEGGERRRYRALLGNELAASRGWRAPIKPNKRERGEFYDADVFGVPLVDRFKDSDLVHRWPVEPSSGTPLRRLRFPSPAFAFSTLMNEYYCPSSGKKKANVVALAAQRSICDSAASRPVSRRFLVRSLARAWVCFRLRRQLD